MARWITVVNNEDSTCEQKCYPGGTTWLDVFADIMPGKNAGDYIIRVNKNPVFGHQEISDGDEVSITPFNIYGGALSTRPEIEDDLDQETLNNHPSCHGCTRNDCTGIFCTYMCDVTHEPKNNGSSEACHWCGQPTEPMFGTLRICRRCNK